MLLPLFAAATPGVLPASFYASAYDNPATPWTTGKPQPAVQAEQASFQGRVLDCGCGAGENSCFLALCKDVTSVTGFDLSPGGVALARDRALELPPDAAPASFFTASAETAASALLPRQFDTALDSALLHCLADDSARAYVGQLAQLVVPGGKVYVGCFSDSNPDPWDNPRRLSEAYLRDLFSEEAGFSVESVREVWWARPPERGTGGGAFCMAHWMVARRL
ncbi:hypothetical protein TeGR_g5252 [Tetraparma gracilis]|uniref:Methyltransferase domain-containing protein n=1 Tax=Tetraparma gracilis TaxID=2962635 RepID=A0ABQ6MFP8_9STRA|nr:hypothetical protein TeGR_g5252 [Tetraparma gracilis]